MNDLAVKLTAPRPVRLTIEDFLVLVGADRIGRWRRAELLDGTIVEMSPEHRRHSRIWSILFRRIADTVDRLPGDLEALLDVSVTMPPHDLPQPDIVVSISSDVENAPIALSDVRLIVEISDASARHDLTTKARLYATVEIAEYWVVDIASACIRRHVEPRDRSYGRVDEIPFGDTITAATIPGLTVDTTGL